MGDMTKLSAPSLLATTLFLHAQENNNGDRLQEELLAVKKALQDNKQLEDSLASPELPREKKIELFDQTFKGFSSVVKETLLNLAEQRRHHLIPEMTKQFADMYAEFNGVVEAVVKTVYPLTDAEKERISAVFAKKLGKKALRIRNEIEPDLLGGLTIRVEDKFYDASVVGKLKRIQRDLTSG